MTIPCAFIAALLLSSAPRVAEGAFYCGDQSMAGNPCGAGDNRCPCCSNGGNCTWWAWHEACFHWRDSLPFCPNAHAWDDSARASGYPVGGDACPGIVFVCEAYSSPCTGGGYGHVGWVTRAFADGSIDISEMGCWGWYGVRGRHLNAQSVSPRVEYIYDPAVGGCSNPCECSPGATQTDGCGWCGHRTRRCGSDCKWGGWSACTGEGECPAGRRESRACCDCGSQSRTCSSSCRWGGWSACAGPDPDGGNVRCGTGECGPCADGRVRCVNGCKVCRRVYEPVPELCDDIDNDCNCEEDEGSPDRMGAVPPRFGALLEDFSFPAWLEAGAAGAAWVVFRNVGSETWRPGEVLLAPRSALDGTPSRLRPAGGWPSWDVAARLDAPVPPGESAIFTFPVEAAVQDEGTSIVEELVLVGPSGGPIKCPESEVALSIGVSVGGDPALRQGPAQAPVPSGTVETGGGCGCGIVE